MPLLVSGVALASLVVAVVYTTSDDSSPPGTQRQEATPTTADSSGPHLREVDGGPDYYARFSPSLPTGGTFFPIGVWYEDVSEEQQLQLDRRAGLNLYVELTEGSDLGLIRSAGMYAIHSHTDRVGTETAGWLLSDETDMWAGAGDAEWTGNDPGEGDICVPADSRCGYTVMETLREGLPSDERLRYMNYGKGVMFWLSTDEASRFVNRYQDVVSADTYWYTDGNICGGSEGGVLLDAPSGLDEGECRRAANYGRTVDHLRGLVEPRGSKPVWAFVELGHPFTQDDWPTITPEQVRAAVWSSLIHGARGVIYFNHSFGGPCQTQHVLRDPCYADVRQTVTALNAQLTEMAPVLNAPFVDGMTSTSDTVDAATKYHDGSVYVLAGATDPSGGEAVFTLRCFDDATVEVIDESRTVQMHDGRFSDRFDDGEDVHLYRVDATPSCRLGS